MKKNFKKVLVGLVIFVILFLVIAIFLPSKYTVSRSITINSNPKNVFSLFGDFKNWDGWSPWKASDPEAIYTYSDKTSGAGATMSWKGRKVGHGQLTITQYKLNELIKYELKMMDMGMKSQGGIEIVNSNDQVNVTWSDEGKFPWPHGRWFGLFMGNKLDKMIGDDFEKGLNKIKELAEAMPEVDLPEIEVEVSEQKPVNLAGIRKTIPLDSISFFISTSYAKIYEHAKKNRIQLEELPPLCIYHTYDEIKGSSDMEPAVIVPEGFPNSDVIKTHHSYSGKTIVVHYMGNYSNMSLTYAAMEKWMSENGMSPNGSPWEVYITDPEIEKDTSKWQTDIVWPVK